MTTPDQILTLEAKAANAGGRRRDRGFTFVETVITVVLMGVVVVPILAAVRGAIRVSAVSESAAAVETVLVNAADRVQRAPDSSCDLSNDAVLALPTEWPTSSMQVTQQYLSASGWVAGAPTSSGGRGPACPSAGLPAEQIVKRVTLTVTSPDGAVTRRIQVVKSNV